MSTWGLDCNKYARKEAGMRICSLRMPAGYIGPTHCFFFFSLDQSAASLKSHDRKSFSGSHGVIEMMQVQ